MNDQTTTDLDQADEKILTYEVSDEALEAAAGTEPRKQTSYRRMLVTGGVRRQRVKLLG